MAHSATSKAFPQLPAAIKWMVRLVGEIAPDYLAMQGLERFGTPQRPPLSEQQQEFLASAERFIVPYTEDYIVAYRWGNGKTVLLVHGWQASAVAMQAFVEPLLQAGYSVVAIDGPAHGASPGTRTNLQQFGDAVMATMCYLNKVHAIVAHSFGAASTATMLGTRLHWAVNKVVLIGAPARLADVLEQFALSLGLPDKVLSRMAERIESEFGNPPEFFANDVLLQDFMRPILVVHDADDTIVPYSDGKDIAQAVPNARLLTTSGLGHRHILRHSETIQQIVDFIAE